MGDVTERSKKQQFVLKKECLQLFRKQYCLTLRETEILESLITTENSVQEIEDAFYISRRSLQRHIASIYEKTGTKSRIGLFHIYMTLLLEEMNMESNSVD